MIWLNKKKYALSAFAIIIVLLGVWTLFFKYGSIHESQIISDVDKHITENFKKNYGRSSSRNDVKIELSENIGNKKFVLYSFNDSSMGARHGGYAIYEAKGNDKLKMTDFGWTSLSFNERFLVTTNNNIEQTYLMVFGMNNVNEKQKYSCVCGNEEKTEEFSGEYFLRKYAMNNDDSIGFKKLDSE